MTSLFDTTKKIWADIKAWFNYSWSIFIARIEILSGILVGAFASIDWASILTLNFQDAIYSKNNIILAAILIIKGIVSEIGRRAGTAVTVSDQLVPANIAAEKKIKVKK
jgi:hypothetical protein